MIEAIREIGKVRIMMNERDFGQDNREA